MKRLSAMLALLGLAMVTIPAPGTGAAQSPTATVAPRISFCGKFESASIYRFAKIYAIRGTTCPRALRVGRRYDNSGRQTSPWRCFLAHQDLPRLFSCGWGGNRGDVRTFPHALVAVGSKR